MARKTIEGWQAVLGFVAVTLGVIPLVQYAIGVRRGGLLRFVLGDDPGAALWIVPMVVLVVTAASVSLLEQKKSNVTR